MLAAPRVGVKRQKIEKVSQALYLSWNVQLSALLSFNVA